MIFFSWFPHRKASPQCYTTDICAFFFLLLPSCLLSCMFCYPKKKKKRGKKHYTSRISGMRDHHTWHVRHINSFKKNWLNFIFVGKEQIFMNKYEDGSFFSFCFMFYLYYHIAAWRTSNSHSAAWISVKKIRSKSRWTVMLPFRHDAHFFIHQ